MRRLASHLRGLRDLKVVTNGLTVAMEFSRSKAAQVFVLSGSIDFAKMATVGPSAEVGLSDIRVPRVFLGVSGISAVHGVSMYNPQEAQINRAFVEAADEVFVVVDSSKFSSQALFRIAPLSQVKCVITDEGISKKDKDSLRRSGVEVIIA